MAVIRAVSAAERMVSAVPLISEQTQGAELTAHTASVIPLMSVAA